MLEKSALATSDRHASVSVTLERLSSPIGVLLLVEDSDGSLRSIDWEERESAVRSRLHGAGIDIVGTAAPSRRNVDHIRSYLAGNLSALDQVKIALTGTAFQLAVWDLLRKIPAGATSSYGELAALLGRPGAARAVGCANGANPIPIVEPCHRVIGANGSLTGFGGGMARKKWLLAHEGAAARDAGDR